jgi:uncharacterized protein YegP (UPF0339 family)
MTNNNQPEQTDNDPGDKPETPPPETVQTVQRPPYFEVAQGQDGKWHWMLWSGNGRQLAMNVFSYERQNDCTSAIKTINEAMKKGLKIVIAHPIG